MAAFGVSAVLGVIASRFCNMKRVWGIIYSNLCQLGFGCQTPRIGSHIQVQNCAALFAECEGRSSFRGPPAAQIARRIAILGPY